MKIVCKTLFDCTYTGVTGNLRAGQLPYTTKAGVNISTQEEWLRARNQQRNWETLLQIISLNAQPDIISTPAQIDNAWQFEFTVESTDVFGATGNADPLAGLKQNCNGVPMIPGITQTVDIDSLLKADGADQNIWFNAINTPLE